MPEPLQPDDPLSLHWLNGLNDEANAGKLRVNARSGLLAMTTPWGTYVRNVNPPDGWFLVTASLGSGAYTLHEQIEAASGGWSTGVRVCTGYESNANASVPAASTVRVWATFKRGSWRFTYGACS